MELNMLPEWKSQKGTILIFPKKNSDWKCCYKKVLKSFVNFVEIIAKFQKVFILTQNIKFAKSKINSNNNNIKFIKIDSNDTWARDSLGIEIKDKILDFQFNGWGNKFDASLDNLITKKLFKQKFYSDKKIKKLSIILEGGAIETNEETLLTTTSAVANRNRSIKKGKLEKQLLKLLKLKKIVWIKNSYLAGDDTDGHIDMLVRFGGKKTILYYPKRKLEKELFKKFPKFKLIKLPIPTKKTFNKKILPQTYLNFIFVKNSVLIPFYGVKEDKKALKIFKKVFPKREIIPIKSNIFIRQGGSLHCLTMQIFS
jgi:agmatine/peptidylarginine deiminase